MERLKESKTLAPLDEIKMPVEVVLVAYKRSKNEVRRGHYHLNASINIAILKNAILA
ncbi:8678_t:CDS:2 [Dentiscutata erythropus]|uniref:8678_t:CDS:1 n=1 Tax=Dentiscutata erythropus TaxID=1348616 RepID=A0A9N9HZX8_9GLOM|nr:8678_t:CDS:2 [Dentiscutata erythropus]